MFQPRRRTSTFSSSLGQYGTTSSSSTKKAGNQTTSVSQRSNSKKSLSKPAWDSTVSDLNQLKPSKEELEKRKADLKSKNADIVKFEKIKQEMLKSAATSTGKKSNDATKHQLDSKARLALIQQILYDDEQLKSLIDKSDSTLKFVKDLFLEDNGNEIDTNHSSNTSNQLMNNNTKSAKINLTLAPNVTNLNDSILPLDAAATKSKDQKSASDTKVNFPNSITDLDSLEKINKFKSELENYEKLLMLKMALNSGQEKTSSSSSVPLSPPVSERGRQSVNQASIQSNKPLQTEMRDEFSALSGHHNQQYRAHISSTISSVNDEFQRVLGDLEKKFADFEEQLKRNGVPRQQQQQVNNSFMRQTASGGSSSSLSSSSYTLTLVRMVASLLEYVRETCNELSYEKMKQAELAKQLDIHRKLIDGLTSEIILVKEQNQKILNENVNQNAKIEAELDQIKNNPIIDLQSTFKTPFAPFQHQPLMTSQQPVAPPPLIDPNPKLSAFTYKPTPQQQQPQSQQTRRANSGDDKFTERLSAMLQQEPSITNMSSSSTSNLYPTRSFYGSQPLIQRSTTGLASVATTVTTSGSAAQSDILITNHYDSAQHVTSARPLSAMDESSSSRSHHFQQQQQQQHHLQSNHRHSLRETQLDQQKKQASTSQHSVVSDTTTCSLTDNVNELKKKTEALERLKREQKLVKEQLERLNRERTKTTAADQDLDVLSQNSLSSSSSSKSSSKTKQDAMKTSSNEQSNAINMKRMANLNLNCNSPNLSPISPENVFQDTRS